MTGKIGQNLQENDTQKMSKNFQKSIIMGLKKCGKNGEKLWKIEKGRLGKWNKIDKQKKRMVKKRTKGRKNWRELMGEKAKNRQENDGKSSGEKWRKIKETGKLEKH